MAAKSVGFRLFPGAGEGFSTAILPSPSSLRDATSPEVRGKGSSATFLALPSGELSSGARLRGLVFRQRPCPLRHGLRRATSPEVGGKGSSATFLALPLGELSSGARLRGLVFPSATLPSPSRLAPCHLSRSERQGLFRRVLGSPFGRAVERSETESQNHRLSRWLE